MPSPDVSAGASSRGRRAVDAVIAVGILLVLGCAVVVFAMRGIEDPESARLMALGGLPAALVSAVVTALALTGAPVASRAAWWGAGGMVPAAGLPCGAAIALPDGYGEGPGSALLFALLLVPLAELLGILVGMIVLWPVVVLLQALTRRGDRAPRTILTMVLLLLVAISGATATAALDTHGWSPSRGSGLAMFAVVFGVPIDAVTVRSEPMLWVTRVLVAVMVACVLAYFRVERREERARRAPRTGGQRPRTGGQRKGRESQK
ncbi:conserved membrane hypothetical protein [Microbacterium sp. 8M]|uniref:hypothetical protein n=1 Tax=Microbacterium sp. 8M TaxID=2653153 RepID=UPI0012F2FE5B|nr:hypothetical protein [Microbacterium sp. 8M]VXB55476.1 conserved membrane hypothetical protein [Microbacterium sp. 8M]